MSPTISSRNHRGAAQRPHLRLLRSARQALEESRDEHLPTPRRQACGRPRILVAGADPERRAAVLRDLSQELPSDTQFGEAGAVSEVLAQAPSSGVVMLAGELDEGSAESLMQVLGDRHPSLPVVALGVFAESEVSRTAPPAVRL
jgi:hypothetical protein